MGAIKVNLDKRKKLKDGSFSIVVEYRQKGAANSAKFRTGVHAKQNEFDFKTTKENWLKDPFSNDAINQVKDKVKRAVDTFRFSGNLDPSNDDVKKAFEKINQPEEEKKPESKVGTQLSLFETYEKFIVDSEEGKRTTRRGKKISAGTIKNYRALYNNKTGDGILKEFERAKKVKLDWPLVTYNDFYIPFCNWLWDERVYHKKVGSFDNSVGKNINIFKAFLNYCFEELEIIPTKIFNRKWITWVENEVDSAVLYPDEISWLYNVSEKDLKNFDPVLPEIRDRFIVGTQTCMRIGDLQAAHFQKMGDVFSFNIISEKTDTRVKGKLSKKASDIIRKYPNNNFPKISDQEYNRRLKTLGQFMKHNAPSNLTQDWKGQFEKNRLKRGEVVKELVPLAGAITTHTQRRSGITSLIISNKFSRTEAKKISGHATDREFEKYVKIAEHFSQTKKDTHWDEEILVDLEV